MYLSISWYNVENVQKCILNIFISEWFILLKISIKYSCPPPFPSRIKRVLWGKSSCLLASKRGLCASIYSMEMTDPWVTRNGDSESEWDDLEMLSDKPALMLLSWFVIPDHTLPCLLKGLIFVLWKKEMQSEVITLGSPGGNVTGCPLILRSKSSSPSGCCPLWRGESPWSPHYHDPSSSGLQSPLRCLSQHLLPLVHPFLQGALKPRPFLYHPMKDWGCTYVYTYAEEQSTSNFFCREILQHWDKRNCL